jgi:CelD/BcsL family acetyltransferase involved in cellulose biosynthesis
MIEITLARVTDWAALGERWRELEARSTCSFFQSWTWMGCLAEERFSDPVLLEASIHGRLLAMALFNRRRSRTGRQVLWLCETGVPALDKVFIEYNGILTADSAPSELVADCLRAARLGPIGGRRPWRGRSLVLSGVDRDTMAAALSSGGGSWLRQTLVAPYVDLERVRRNGADYLAGLSANARYQLRRSDRAYAAGGDLAVRRAGSVAEAHDFLGALAALHQAVWNRRGRPGAFADPQFGRFHRALIERGLPRGETELLRVTLGERPVGFLYNFRFRGQVLAYQSGFDYAGAGRHQKPGLTCHHRAIRLAASSGAVRYDFLAGDDRYKRSLANAENRLFWLVLGAGWPIRRCIERVRDLLAATAVAADDAPPPGGAR